MFTLAQGRSSAPEERGHWPVLQLRCSASTFGNLTYFLPLLTVFILIRGACYSVSCPLFLTWTSVFVNIWPIGWSVWRLCFWNNPVDLTVDGCRADEGRVQGGFSQSPWIPNGMTSSSGSIGEKIYYSPFQLSPVPNPLAAFGQWPCHGNPNASQDIP